MTNRSSSKMIARWPAFRRPRVWTIGMVGMLGLAWLIGNGCSAGAKNESGSGGASATGGSGGAAGAGVRGSGGRQGSSGGAIAGPGGSSGGAGGTGAQLASGGRGTGGDVVATGGNAIGTDGGIGGTACPPTGSGGLSGSGGASSGGGGGAGSAGGAGGDCFRGTSGGAGGGGNSSSCLPFVCPVANDPLLPFAAIVVGQPISVGVRASSPTIGLTFEPPATWEWQAVNAACQASGGIFADPHAAVTTFTCTVPGDVTITAFLGLENTSCRNAISRTVRCNP